jgi:hypothetical protein
MSLHFTDSPVWYLEFLSPVNIRNILNMVARYFRSILCIAYLFSANGLNHAPIFYLFPDWFQDSLKGFSITWEIRWEVIKIQKGEKVSKRQDFFFLFDIFLSQSI